MSHGRRRHPFSDNPTAIGAITVLITVLVVFLAYNANSGLPFVRSYRVSALVGDAAALVAGNEVRRGGVRIGLVESIEPVITDRGRSAARLNLKLDELARPVPSDSRVVVRSRSALGLKYLELTPGAAEDGLPEGDTLPLAQARPDPVELDQFLNTFDRPTRIAAGEGLRGFGGALAGRGEDLNRALGTLPATLRVLEPVARNLAAEDTGLARFVRAAAAAAGEAAPVGESQARLVIAMAGTFAALERSNPGLARTIERSPGALREARRSLPPIGALLGDTRRLATALRPAATTLAEISPGIERAFTAITPSLERAPRLNRSLPPTAAALRAFGEDPDALRGIAALRGATDELSPTLRFVEPAQTACNYGALLLRNLASVFSLGDGIGTRQRFIAFQPPLGEGGEGSPAAVPANGPGAANHLHINPYPNTAAPGQPRECEAGNESYAIGETVIGNAPGNQGTETEASR